MLTSAAKTRPHQDYNVADVGLFRTLVSDSYDSVGYVLGVVYRD